MALDAQLNEFGVVGWLLDFGQDVRYAIRGLRQSPGFAAVAILTLAIGIGATTAIYSVVNAVLLQPLPFADADRLVRVVENVPTKSGQPPRHGGITYQEFLDWRARTTTLSDTVGVMPSQILLRTAEGTARLWGARTSAHTFAMLGTRAVLGRTLDPSDDANSSVVVLGFDAWRRLFQSDPRIVGKTLELQTAQQSERRMLTVVGVLPDGFEFPTEQMDFYTPLGFDEFSKGWASVTMIGRVSRGVSLKAASDEANIIGRAVRPPPRADAAPLIGPRFDVLGLKDEIVQTLRPALRVLLAAVAVVLLIVCANVASLLLARGTARQREVAVRLAIGASRGRVVRQVLTECVVLAAVGGALGGLFGAAGVGLVKQLASVEAPGIFRLMFGATILPRGSEIGVDLDMLGLALGIAAVTSLVFGVLPAVHMSRTSHLQAMGSRGGGSNRRESRLRAALVVGQLVMATVLLVVAGLLTLSFVKLAAVDRGYDPTHVLAFQLVFPPDYSIARKANTIESLLARLRGVPSVESAGFTRAGMLIGEQITLGTFVPQGRTLDQMRAYPVWPSLRPVSPGYLTAMGVRVLDGRDLQTADAAGPMPEIVIGRAVSRQFGGAGRAVGQFVDWHNEGPVVQMRVVGVVDDLRNTSAELEPYPEVFIDYRQLLKLQQRWGDSSERQSETSIGLLSFAVRTRGDPALAVPLVTRIVRSVDPNAGIDAIVPLTRLVASSVARQRFYAVMLGVFAGVAGFLAAIGIYGMLAYAVVQRTQEIGVRMALGAQREQVLALVLRKGVILTAIGVGLGLLGAAAGTRFLQGLLFGVTPLDPMTFFAVALMFGLVAMLASYVPARRATAVDPMVALRTD